MKTERFEYDTKPLFDAFPAFEFFPETVLSCVITALDYQIQRGADPQSVFAFARSKAGMITLADLVFDGFNLERQIA